MPSSRGGDSGKHLTEGGQLPGMNHLLEDLTKPVWAPPSYAIWLLIIRRRTPAVTSSPFRESLAQ